jgi:hypothetical protein
MSPNVSAQTITLDQLVDLRAKTERLSEYLAGRLRAHLATLYPILSPRRTFGKYIGVKETVPRADEAYAQLSQKYRDACGLPFDLRSDLDDQALSAMEFGLEIYPWEYTHDIGGKSITITSPVRWIVMYKADYSPSQVRAILAGKGEKKTLALRQFVVNALATQIVVTRTPGVAALLEDLRYVPKIETAPGLAKLSVFTIGFPIPSFRPADELISSATKFSGVPAFIELVDTDGIAAINDPMREKVESVLRG